MFFVKENAKFYFWLSIVIVLLGIAVMAPFIAPYDPLEAVFSRALQPPCKEHWFGTDVLGRDLFSRVIYGLRTSVGSSLVLLAGISIVGTALGVVAGYCGGWVDALIMRVADTMIAFPDLILAIAIAGILGSNLINAMLAIAVVSWTKYARLSRSLVLKIKDKDYIAAAKTVGTKNGVLILHYYIPNIMPTMMITATTDVGTIMLSLASLSFLGFGIQPPTPEWGFMLSEGRNYLQSAPWLLIYPGFTIFIVVSAFNLLGDSLRDMLDPQSAMQKYEQVEKKNYLQMIKNAIGGRKMRKKKGWVANLCIAVLATSMLTGCATTHETQDTVASKTKTQLNVAVDALASSLEPATNWESWFLVRCGIGETLVRYGEDGSFEPWLAERWEVAEDNLTWTIHLKQGVKFSNGVAMTATKVKESIERLYRLEDPANGGIGNPHGYMTYSSIKADDIKGTVTIVTEQPVPDMPGCLAYPWMLIVDAEASEGIDTTQMSPICTGPYMVERFTVDTDVQLVRNENYWNGEVPFERVNVMKVGESSTKTMALQDGSVDMSFNIATADYETLKTDENIAIDVVSGLRLGYAHINFGSELGNDTLRKAVRMAVDGQTIADVVTSNSYTFGAPVISSSCAYGYEQLTNPYKYNVEAAKKMLDDAGIVDTNGDGYRELEGEMIDIHYPTTSMRQLEVIAQAVAAQLDSIGIKCTVELVDSNIDILNNSSYDMCGCSEVTMATGDPCKFLRHWYSESVDNYDNYCNEEYDEIFEKLEVEFDTEKRTEYIIQLQQILLNDATVLNYGYYNYNLCATKNITGAKCSTSDFYWITKDVKPAQ